jgi:hypothetical protein
MNYLITRSKYSKLVLASLAFATVHGLAVLFDDFQNGPIFCPFRLIFGIPCPMCGITRSIGALSRGQFDKSLHFNPLGILVALCALLLALPSEKLLSALQRRWQHFRSRTITYQLTWIVALYATLWIFDLLRVMTSFYSN